MNKNNSHKCLNTGLIKKKMIIVFGILMLFLFNGCWDLREVENLGLVQALGLDVGPNGKGVTITTMIAIPSQITIGGGRSEGEKGTGVFIISMDSPTIYEGFDLINTTVNREITLLQNSILIISEDLAKKGFRKWVDNLVRFREMRRTVLIFICKGRASDIMNIKPQIEKNSAEYFSDLTMESTKTGMFPITHLHDLLRTYESYMQESYAPYLVKYQRKEPNIKETPPGGDKNSEKTDENSFSSENTKLQSQAENVRIEGTAVFKQDKLVGILDLYESQAFTLLTDQFREAILSVPDPGKINNEVVIRLKRAIPPKVKYHRKKGENHFTVNLKLEADLISIQSNIDYTDPKMEEILSNQIARILRKRIEKVIIKAQQNYDSDVFGFGIVVRKTFFTINDWHQYGWPKKFKTAKFKIDVKVFLRRVGVQFHPPVLR